MDLKSEPVDGGEKVVSKSLPEFFQPLVLPGSLVLLAQLVEKCLMVRTRCYRWRKSWLILFDSDLISKWHLDIENDDLPFSWTCIKYNRREPDEERMIRESDLIQVEDWNWQIGAGFRSDSLRKRDNLLSRLI